MLRTVASNEPHSLLQYVLFAYAQREEDLAAELAHMKDFSEESKVILDDWNKKLITPMRVRFDKRVFVIIKHRYLLADADSRS